jgi:hypothetical protein
MLGYFLGKVPVVMVLIAVILDVFISIHCVEMLKDLEN